MPKVTFVVSDAHKQVMDDHPEVNWSEVFRQAIWQHAEREEVARHIWEEVNDPQAKAITKLIKEAMGRRYLQDLRAYRRGRERRGSRPPKAQRVDRRRTVAKGPGARRAHTLD